jgi:DNA-directed RNA polymerase beta subunit
MCDSAASMVSSRMVTIKKPAAKKSVNRVIDNVAIPNPSDKPAIESIDHPPAHEELIKQVDTMIRSEIAGSKFNQQEASMLEHLGEYLEEPYTLIESYFRAQHLERLVRHQIESYNHFINYQIQRTIEMFNPVVIRSENDYVADRGHYFLEAHVSFDNFKLYPPQIHENNGATKMMLPQEAKLRNFTYASIMTVDVKIKYIVRNTDAMDTPKIITKTLPKINIGKMPIMLKSSICVLAQNRHIQSQYTGECSMDCGGYFIIKGSEKTVLGQERAAENRVYCFDGRNNAKWNWIAEMKSIPDFKCISPKQIEMMIASKNCGFGHGIYVNIPRIKQPIELFVVFRALGILSDREICEYILLNVEEKANSSLLTALQGSIVEANKYLTQEDALRHITAYAAYTPMNMDRETGQNKKREFTVEVLNNDLFPHCQTMPQKIMMLGYMANKLIQTSLGWLPCDDRDSYLNKRIDLTGTLLNNLFRNYFNKLVKEMQKQVVREINGGSWRSTEDYENIINMTNIYKIMKSTTIENGITRALSTGDFSIKQANSSKVGVAQVLNRLTYVASLSHLRRVNTPLEKSGELIAPRKLHNTTWGFLCLTGDSEVLLSDRVTIKKIKDMKDGDCVTTVNPETLCDEPSEIHSFFRKMPDKLFEITTISGRKIKATANHPFLVNVNGKGEWKNLEDLNVGYDQVIMHHTGFRNQPNDNIYMHDGVNILNNGCVSVPILSIAEIEPEFVYDFTTRSDNHSFVASSFVVHNCPAETPEGQSIGIVKNISYMSHITIPTKSASLYEYVQPYIQSVDSVRPPELYGKVKVFVNGTWVGVCEKPFELYESLKEKKYRGIINIYTAIVFDYKLMQIRICNDGGRLTRPLLRVRDNKAIITPDIIEKVDKHELAWNDLLTSCRIDESVVEYIDPEEQNYSMVAMKTKHGYLGESATYNYTHCEIHPSTIFGVLASCIPFPEHNQAPRNTYQCLGTNELVWMADGTKKKICDVNIGESVLSFHPETMEVTSTRVINQFVRKNEYPIYRLTTMSGREITATEDHKFMTIRGWKTVKELIETPEIQINMFNDSHSYVYEHIYITPEPDGLISDITVESENHSFIASSGFASSNCAMAKQAIGVYALNYDQRMDKTAYVLSYPSRPLVDTRLMNFIHLNQIPSGCQIHVAIMTHTGYNQEDSVLVNKGSIDRGLFGATIYHTEKDEDKNIIRDEIIRCKPDKTKTKGIKFGNYDKVNNQGFIPENTMVENRDVIIAKIIPIKENRNDPTKTIKYEDQSKTFRTTEETYIDKNYTGRNGDGYNFAKVRVRVHRKPGYGDKFSSRHGQKGTCGNIIPECDMPFTKNGLRPDIIINPHAIPSRMTIAQLKETLLGKVLLEVGMFGDGTSFGNLDIKTIIQELQKLGYESHGNEVMYNGLTGEQLETSIFIGPVFYQRLKHMVADKQHSRAIGPMVNLTRQPAEGRSRDGGFRIGEMERDVMIAHGMSKFCRERLYDVSDKYSTHVCRKCGMIASYNDGNKNKGSDFSVHLCNTCNNMTDFAKVEIPYAYKLMSQELQAINVVPRLITE